MTRKVFGLKSVPTKYALRLDGISGSVKVNAAASINDLTTFTVVATLIPNSPGEADFGYIFKKGPKLFYIPASSTFRFYNVFNTLSGYWTAQSNSLPYNIRTHIAMSYDNTNVVNNPIMYKNGISVVVDIGQIPEGAAISESGTNLFIGNDDIDSRTFDGLIYSFAYFNVILNPTQVSNLSNGTQIPTDIPGCVLYHDYTKGNANDLSGNNNNGTLQGNAFFEPQSQFS